MGVYSGLSLYWPDLTEDELRRVLAELEDWVAWARVASRRLDDVLRECWPLHPGVVHQLAAWQAWWWAIYRPRLSGDQPPARGAHSGQAAIAWWDALDSGRQLRNRLRAHPLRVVEGRSVSLLSLPHRRSAGCPRRCRSVRGVTWLRAEIRTATATCGPTEKEGK